MAALAIVDSLQCGCNIGKVYASKATFQKHKSTDRHKVFELGLQNKELRTELVRLDNDNRRLQHVIVELEALKNPRRVSEAKKKRVAAAQQWVCAMCLQCLPAAYQIDHTVALRNGGCNNESNLQALCPDCHASKTQCGQ